MLGGACGDSKRSSGNSGGSAASTCGESNAWDPWLAESIELTGRSESGSMLGGACGDGKHASGDPVESAADILGASL